MANADSSAETSDTIAGTQKTTAIAQWVERVPQPPNPSPTWARPAELAAWHPQWRERWGRRANELEEQGVAFPESERRAFAEIKAEKAKPQRIVPRPPTAGAVNPAPPKAGAARPTTGFLNLQPEKARKR